MQKRILTLALIALLGLMGCESMSDGTKKGATIGGLVGAAAGGIAGHQSGHGWEGALIGGAAGAVGGGLIGSQMDKKAQASNPEHLTVMEIVDMTEKGAPPDVIIGEIKRTNSVYELTSEIISFMQEKGVSNRVIDYMMGTKN